MDLHFKVQTPHFRKVVKLVEIFQFIEISISTSYLINLQVSMRLVLFQLPNKMTTVNCILDFPNQPPTCIMDTP